MFFGRRAEKNVGNRLLFINRKWLALMIIVSALADGGATAAVQPPSTAAPDRAAVTARPNATADCVARKTCSDCLDAAPACSWSLVHQSCNGTAATEKRLAENPNDDGHHHPPTQAVVDIRSCPRLTVRHQKQTTLDTTNRTVDVLVSNDTTGGLRKLLVRGGVLCHMNELEYAGRVVDGGRQIKCQSNYSEAVNSSLSSTVYFEVTMNGVRLPFDRALDHYLQDSAVPRNACVTAAGDECKTCLWDHDPYRYYCQWCPASNACTGSYHHCDVRRLADPGTAVRVPDVLVRCPEVRIESIAPLYGSWAGGTTVRIVISNHRTLAENMVTVVTVADSRCLLPTVSMDGAAVECTIPPSNSSALREGPVEVTYRSDDDKSLPTFTLRSNQTFYFVEPTITSVLPACGPTSGGTRVTIRGRFLDAGNTVRVYMRDNITCAVQTHTQNEVTCVTGASDGPAAGAVRVEFDHYLNKYVHDPPFVYTSAPAVDGGQTFRGIASGGTRLPVTGRNFACIRNPLVHVKYNGIQYTGGCVVHNDTRMVCTAPTINRPAPHQVTALEFGFQADYNDTIVGIQPPADTADYTLYPDPVYTDFETDGGRTVTVYGLNLDQGYDDADLSVVFHKSGVPCNVTSVQPDRIVCQPPARPAAGGRADPDPRYDEYGDDYGEFPAALVNDEILVTVGNLVYEVKRKPQMTRHNNSLRINTVIFGGIALVSLLITVVAAIVYCAKIVMTVSSQQTEMRSLCEHLNAADTTVTEPSSTVRDAGEDPSAPAPTADGPEKTVS